jgi:hypothetical protein
VVVTAILLLVVAGSIVFCALTIMAARRYLAAKPIPRASGESISVLKPLSGDEDQLEANLRTFFTQA